MSAFIRWSMRMRGLVAGLAVALLVLGALELREARVDVLPESTPPYVEIQTEALGLSAAEVEQLVTVPMEALMLNGVAWVESTDSRSVPGLSSIRLTFEPGTDLMRARQMVQERLTQAHALPNVSKPPQMIQPLSSASRVMILSLSSTTLSPIDLSVLARWTIRPRLMGVEGVANVAIWGQRERQLQVLVDPQRLNQSGIRLDQIVSTTGNALWVSPLSFLNASTPGAGGFIDTPNQRFGIRHVLPIRTPEDLARVPLEGAPTLQVGDVARIVEDHQPLIGDASTDDGQALLLVVEKLPGEDVASVTKGVESALAAMAPGLPGVTIDTAIYRPATFVESAIGNIALTLALGAAIIALVTLAFLRQLRAVAIVILAAACSMLAAMLVLHVTGSTINVLIIAGLVVALAIVLDDAIVDVEEALRDAREPRDHAVADELPRGERIALAIGLMRGRMGFATVIVLLVILPVLVLEGTVGSFLRPFGMAFALAVAASALVGLTLTPILAALLLSDAKGQADRHPMADADERASSQRGNALQSRYSALLGRTVRHRAVAVASAGLLLIAAVVIVPRLAPDLAPAFQERDLFVDVTAAPGTSRVAMNRITAQASAELRALPGVERVGTHVGRAVMADEIVNVSSGQLWVRLAADAPYDATVAAIRDVMAGYPGLSAGVGSYLSDRAASAFADPAQGLAVRVFGPEPERLLEAGEMVRAAIATVPGVVEPRVEQLPLEPTIQVEVDLDVAARYGVRPGDVRRAAATLVNGLEVGNLFEEQKVFEVIVMGGPELRHSLTSISALRIDTPSGSQVTLGELADVRLVAAPTEIERSGISRYVDVVADVAGRDISAVQGDVTAAIRGLAFPLEYHAEVSADQADRTAGLIQVLAVVIAVVVAVFLVLQAASRSWRLAIVSIAVVALALAGWLVTAFIAAGGLSLGALAGAFAVVAIAARNLLALLARLPVPEADHAVDVDEVIRAATERLRPILMTLLTMSLALAPVLVLGERPGLEILRPIAVVIIGGLLTTAFLVLFVVPTIYVWMYGSPSPAATIEPSVPASPDTQPAGAS